jgi:hypothetical protein
MFKTVQYWLTVPIAFYGNSEHMIIEAPETADVLLAGRRTDFYKYDLNSLCIHINTDTWHVGTYHIPITAELLFLPESIKVLNYYPSYITAQVQINQLINQKESNT